MATTVQFSHWQHPNSCAHCSFSEITTQPIGIKQTHEKKSTQQGLFTNLGWTGRNSKKQADKTTPCKQVNRGSGGVGVGGWGIESHATLKGVDEELRKGAKNWSPVGATLLKKKHKTDEVLREEGWKAYTVLHCPPHKPLGAAEKWRRRRFNWTSERNRERKKTKREQWPQNV